MRPKWRDRALDHLVDLLGLAHVDLHRERIEPGVAQARRCPTPGSSSCGCRSTIARAELAEPLRDREPDAGAAAGDDGDLIVRTTPAPA